MKVAEGPSLPLIGFVARVKCETGCLATESLVIVTERLFVDGVVIEEDLWKAISGQEPRAPCP